MRVKFKLLIMVFILLCVGCTKDTDPGAEKQDSDTNEQVEDNDASDSEEQQEITDNNGDEFQSIVDESIPNVPENTSGFIHQTAGPYSGVDVKDDNKIDEVTEKLNELEPLPEDATDEQLDDYYKYFYSLVAEDFPDPQEIIKKWEFGSFGDPDLPDSRYHFKENYNIEVLLDASGSMGAYIGDKTMMQIAKESINDFMKQIPEDANVSFRVYGHKGTGDKSDKEMSCAAIEQVYGYASYNEAEFQKELNKIEPAGWTPLADALKQAENALEAYDAEHNTNLIYVVSDGVETCDGDPVRVAQTLGESNAKPIINIIGFNVDTDAQKQLKEMAKVSDGVFATANNQDELNEEFNRAEEVLEAWEKWKEDAIDKAEFSETENFFDILAVTNKWFDKSIKQSINLWELINLAESEGIINYDQNLILNEMGDKTDQAINKSGEEIESELEKISAENVEEMKQSIKKKYDKQTSE